MSRFCIAMLIFTAACAIPAPSPWGSIDTDAVYLLGEGTRIIYEEDGVSRVDLALEGGRFILNGEDIGDCSDSRQVRFEPDGALLVDGRERARIARRP